MNLVVLLLALLLRADALLACASCGSGGDDPLILYPNEPHKIYVAISDESGFRTLQYDRDEVRGGGILRKRAATVGYGVLLSTRSFITTTWSIRSNYGETRQLTGVGDPALTYRHAVVAQTFAAPLLPQVQLLAGLKPAFARGPDTSRDPELLDALGTGYHEARLGFDVWSGMTWLQYGISNVWGLSFPKEEEGQRNQPGMRTVTTISFARTTPLWKVVAGLTRAQTASRTYRSTSVPRSDAEQGNAFLTLDWKIEELATLRVTGVETAAFGSNYNTYSSRLVQLAYMQVLP